jgi:DNA-binding HxlR family transcriptional regulator
MPTPHPKTTTGRPIVLLLELLGRRWTLRILWELRTGQPVTYAHLRQASDRMSTSVLATRLGELVDAHLIQRLPDGSSHLTAEGTALIEHLTPLDTFAKHWAGHRS